MMSENIIDGYKSQKEKFKELFFSAFVPVLIVLPVIYCSMTYLNEQVYGIIILGILPICLAIISILLYSKNNFKTFKSCLIVSLVSLVILLSVISLGFSIVQLTYTISYFNMGFFLAKLVYQFIAVIYIFLGGLVSCLPILIGSGIGYYIQKQFLNKNPSVKV